MRQVVEISILVNNSGRYTLHAVWPRILDTLVSQQHARDRVQRVVVGWKNDSDCIT